MSKKKVSCPDCGKKLLKASMKRHLEKTCGNEGTGITESNYDDDEYIPTFSGLRGEIGRLADKMQEDPVRWTPVRDAYIKNRGDNGNTKEQRIQLRKEIGKSRIREQW